MSVSPAFVPDAGHPAPEPFGYRPLAAIAAASAGGVPQKRIGRVLSEIAPALTSLHERGRVHGAVSVHTVGLDESGHAHLLVPALYPDRPGAMEPASCFAAAEQFDPDPAQACGPATDVYALCAVMCSLVSGSPPPHALARRAQDHYVPLTKRKPRGYDEAFLAAIDQGLSLGPSQRPSSVAALCEMMGVSYLPMPQEDVAVETRSARAAMASHAPRKHGGGYRPRRPTRLLAVVAGILLAAGVWVWLVQDDGDGWSGPALVGSRSGLIRPSPPDPGAGRAVPVSESGPAVGNVSNPDSGATSSAGTEAAPDIWGRVPDTPASRAAAESPVISAEGQNPAADPGTPLVASATPPVAPATPRVVPGSPAPRAGDPATPEAGGTQPARPARPANVAVKVDVFPWGEIFVDGVSRGVSPPLKSLNLPAGRHTVEVRNADLPPYRTSLDLKPGQPVTVRHVFR